MLLHIISFFFLFFWQRLIHPIHLVLHMLVPFYYMEIICVVAAVVVASSAIDFAESGKRTDSFSISEEGGNKVILTWENLIYLWLLHLMLLLLWLLLPVKPLIRRIIAVLWMLHQWSLLLPLKPLLLLWCVAGSRRPIVSRWCRLLWIEIVPMSAAAATASTSHIWIPMTLCAARSAATLWTIVTLSTRITVTI